MVFVEVPAPQVSYEWLRDGSSLSEEDVRRVNRLLAELSEGSSDRKKDPVTSERIQRIVQTPDFHLLLARNTLTSAPVIIGMATICIVDHLDGLDAMVHDVVVLKLYRRHGVGEGLVDRVIERARELGVRYLELTCAPFRVRANALYDRKGFVVRNTNARRLHLTESEGS